MKQIVNSGRSYKDFKKTSHLETFLLSSLFLIFFKTSFIIPRKMIRYFDSMSSIQQSRKLAAMSSSSAISGWMGNSGISVELLV